VAFRSIAFAAWGLLRQHHHARVRARLPRRVHGRGMDVIGRGRLRPPAPTHSPKAEWAQSAGSAPTGFSSPADGIRRPSWRTMRRTTPNIGRMFARPAATRAAPTSRCRCASRFDGALSSCALINEYSPAAHPAGLSESHTPLFGRISAGPPLAVGADLSGTAAGRSELSLCVKSA
jgi:hypothetical protein